MKGRLPILIIIPHGGQRVPDELSGLEVIDRFNLFIESDTCANELFAFENEVISKIDTQISRLFVDLDRSPLSTTQRSYDGVLKRETITGKKIYRDGVFPDEIAMTNILKRYYFPLHKSIERIINKGEIKFIIDCHTMLAVGAKNSVDSGKPRPLIIIENIVKHNEKDIKTCTDELALGFLECMKTFFSEEDATVAGRFNLNNNLFNPYILKKYGLGSIPMLRFSISRSLFLNDTYFSYDYLRIDDIRISELRKMIWKGIEKFSYKYL